MFSEIHYVAFDDSGFSVLPVYKQRDGKHAFKWEEIDAIYASSEYVVVFRDKITLILNNGIDVRVNQSNGEWKSFLVKLNEEFLEPDKLQSLFKQINKKRRFWVYYDTPSVLVYLRRTE